MEDEILKVLKDISESIKDLKKEPLQFEKLDAALKKTIPDKWNTIVSGNKTIRTNEGAIKRRECISEIIKVI